MSMKRKAGRRRWLWVLLALLVTFAATDYYFSSKGHDGWLQIIASQRLKKIADAQQKYRTGPGGSSYGSFKQLVGAGLLDESYDSDSPVIGGYRFTMRLESGTGGRQPEFNVSADPHPADNWLAGKYHYYMDSSATIHGNRWRSATADD